MNKLKFIIFIFIFIVLFCIIGSIFITNGEEIKEKEDMITIQNKINDKINIYGYTFDNMNVIIDPYNMNYNTALIIFETETYESINVNVNNNYSYDSNITNRHYIGVYNLDVGENIITLKYKGKTKKLTINIEEKDNIIDIDNYEKLDNNHLIIPTYDYLKNEQYGGFREVDVFGKIYFEYILDSYYKGLSIQIDDNLLAILSDKLLILDMQNGNIIKSFDVEDEVYTDIDFIDNKIILYTEDSLYKFDYETNYTKNNNKITNVNYNTNNGVRFYNEIETKQVKQNILLLNYNNELKENIEIQKDFNRIVVIGENIKDCNTYLIFDKLMDKRIYNLCDKTSYIYTKGLKGKYTLYIKVEDKIYKTGKYLNFN